MKEGQIRGRNTSLARVCAWCRRVLGPDGNYGVEPLADVPEGASHTICPACKARAIAEVEACGAAEQTRGTIRHGSGMLNGRSG